MSGRGRLPPLTPEEQHALRAALPTLRALAATFVDVAASAPECVVPQGASTAGEEEEEDLGEEGFEPPAARLALAGALAFAARAHAQVLDAVGGVSPAAAEYIRPMLASAAADNEVELRFAATSGRAAFSFLYLLGNPVEGLLVATEPLVR
jgi:hypothetical protein